MRQSAWLFVISTLVFVMVACVQSPSAQEQRQPQKPVPERFYRGTEEYGQQHKHPTVDGRRSTVILSASQNQQKPIPDKTIRGQAKLNPFTGNPEAIAEGHKIYMQIGCAGCHGPGGGGGMAGALPMFDDVWKFGGDDGTLFELIKGRIPNQKMPPVFGAVLKDEQVWKIIAWIRSIYKGDADKIVW